MITPEATELRQRIEQLSLDDRLWLLERLASSVRRAARSDVGDGDLAEMAADPDIQREMRQIAEDFRDLEQPVAERLS